METDESLATGACKAALAEEVITEEAAMKRAAMEEVEVAEVVEAEAMVAEVAVELLCATAMARTPARKKVRARQSTLAGRARTTRFLQEEV